MWHDNSVFRHYKYCTKMVAISKQANYKHCGLHSVTWINAICIVIDWHEISNTGTIRRGIYMKMYIRDQVIWFSELSNQCVWADNSETDGVTGFSAQLLLNNVFVGSMFIAMLDQLVGLSSNWQSDAGKYINASISSNLVFDPRKFKQACMWLSGENLVTPPSSTSHTFRFLSCFCGYLTVLVCISLTKAVNLAIRELVEWLYHEILN